MIPGLMARQVREFYEGLNFEEKKIFLRVLAHDFGKLNCYSRIGCDRQSVWKLYLVKAHCSINIATSIV